MNALIDTSVIVRVLLGQANPISCWGKWKRAYVSQLVHTEFHRAIDRLRLEGHLDDGWQEWFEGFSLITTGDGHTLLRGPIRDQAALHGVLKKISNLGLRLVAINPQHAS